MGMTENKFAYISTRIILDLKKVEKKLKATKFDIPDDVYEILQEEIESFKSTMDGRVPDVENND
jgi:PAB1-binding protein PBP1